MNASWTKYLPEFLREWLDGRHQLQKTIGNTGWMLGDKLIRMSVGLLVGVWLARYLGPSLYGEFNFAFAFAILFSRIAMLGLDETLHFVMDFDLWIRIGKRFHCRYLPEFFFIYRLHEASKTIRDESLFEKCEEGLRVAIKHFDWAPLTRIYTSCSILCKAGLPAFLARNRLAVATAAIVCSLIRSLFLNRGFNRNDLKLFNRENYRKLFKSRLEIMTSK